MDHPIRGRCISIDTNQITVRSASGTVSLAIENAANLSLGDWVEIQGRQARLLTPNRHPQRSMRWMDRTLDPQRLSGVATRQRVEAAIREFFLGREFLETRTPLLVRCPGMETHIRPFRVGKSRYLPTSPEFAMKRLLVGGLEKIFQVCPAFRDEPFSPHHRTEFTLLEWYRSFAGYEEIMRDTEELFAFIARKLLGKAELRYQGQRIDLTPPWPRLRIRELFLEHTGVDLVASADRDHLARECKRLRLPVNDGDNWDDLYFKIWLNLIEPKLPADRAVFVYRYPASQAALSVVDADPDGSRWAKRFEVYTGGFELGNAFEELTDPIEQRKRFAEDMDLREQIYGQEFPRNPMDEEFLEALAEGMPPAGGIAMGVDRMVMLFADQPDIGLTTWLEPH